MSLFSLKVLQALHPVFQQDLLPQSNLRKQDHIPSGSKLTFVWLEHFSGTVSLDLCTKDTH